MGEFGGVKVLVDAESAPILNGVRIDFVESLQGSGFAIENPNARAHLRLRQLVRDRGRGGGSESAGEMSV